MRRPVFSAKYDQHGRRSVKRIKSLIPATDLCIHFCDLITKLLLRYLDNDRCLLPFSACCVKSCFDDLIKQLLPNSIRFIFSDTSSCFHFCKYVAHIQKLLSDFSQILSAVFIIETQREYINFANKIPTCLFFNIMLY